MYRSPSFENLAEIIRQSEVLFQKKEEKIPEKKPIFIKRTNGPKVKVLDFTKLKEEEKENER